MIVKKEKLALGLALLALSSPLFALPTGGAVVSGTATLATSGSTLTVTNSNNAIINWLGFSIGAGETTRFVQPSASSTVLNRVVTSSPSSIFGSLTSNGNVFLVNPNGILFGAGSQVSVGGLTLSTNDVADANFIAGNYNFTGGGSGNITLLGNIDAPAGLTANAGSTLVSGTQNSGVVILNTLGPSTGFPPGATLVLTGTTYTGATVTLSGGTGAVATADFVVTRNSVGTGLGATLTAGTGTFALTNTGISANVGGLVGTSGGITMGGSTATLTPATSQIQTGGMMVASKSLPLQATAPSIAAATLGGGSGATASVSMNLRKREVAF